MMASSQEMVQQKIREKAKELLANKEVDLVIGFGEGSLPLRATPIFVRTPEEADRLVWNSFCDNNLATYIHKLSRFKLGIVAKGCDVRSILALALEKRFQPDRIVLIGVPCQRMVDRRKVKKAVKGEILQAREEGDQLIVEGNDFSVSLKKEDYLYASCKACTHRNPIKANAVVGDQVDETPLTDSYAEAKEFEKMSPEERWNTLKESQAVAFGVTPAGKLAPCVTALNVSLTAQLRSGLKKAWRHPISSSTTS